VFDETGERLTPTYAVKKGTRYRYYVSTSLLTGAGRNRSSGRRNTAEPMSPELTPARAALDRIEIPQDIIDRISEIISPGSSLIISDEGVSTETGEDTDFVILMSGEPQGAIKMRRHDPDLYGRYDRQYGRSPAYAPSFDSAGPFIPW
jgi:hypothetical protein